MRKLLVISIWEVKITDVESPLTPRKHKWEGGRLITLTSNYTKAINDFSNTEENKDVYVLVICTDCNNQSVTLYYNSLSGLTERVEVLGEYGGKYTEESLKYSIGDFKYEDGYDDDQQKVSLCIK